MTLQQVMASEREITLRDKVVYGIQLAEALAYSHASSVVHRDVKPGNIMLSEDGQNVRITDFGIAHIETEQGAAYPDGRGTGYTPVYVTGAGGGSAAGWTVGPLLPWGDPLSVDYRRKAFMAQTLTTLLMEIVQRTGSNKSQSIQCPREPAESG